MEQDIKILEDYIYNKKDTMKEQLVEAINNILSDLYEANNRIADLINTIDERDRIIDLMAEQLTTPVHNKEWVIKYFEERCK